MKINPSNQFNLSKSMNQVKIKKAEKPEGMVYEDIKQIIFLMHPCREQ